MAIPLIVSINAPPTAGPATAPMATAILSVFCDITNSASLNLPTTVPNALPNVLLNSSFLMIALVIVSTTSPNAPVNPAEPIWSLALADAIPKLDTLVDKLSSTFCVAPPNSSWIPFENASVIFAAPSAVLPNSDICNLVRPSCSSSILNTGTPLSASLLSSSRPKPPDTVLANKSVMASNVPI